MGKGDALTKTKERKIMEILRGFISFIVYGLFAKFSIKAIFSVMRSNFLAGAIYGLIAIGIIAWTGEKVQLWSVEKLINTVQSLNIDRLNVFNNNGIRFNVKNFPLQF